MNAKITIRKILFITIWLGIGGGMVTLLLAAITKKNNGVCKDYVISIKGNAEQHFIDKADVEQALKKSVQGKVIGQSIALFNLHELEQTLEHNTWINEAELYFDNKDILHLSVSEKTPVARIFTTGSTSFYIDSSGRKIPLSDKLTARIPVFTGFPDKNKWTAKDSMLLNDIKSTAIFINNDTFWKAQVAQIDITDDGNFEMIPVVGNHLVKLGTGENISQKFNRLMIFYQQVLRKTGFDKYKLIDVQYKGQVVASRYAGNPKVDSIQLRKNVEKMLRHSIDAENDTTIRTLPAIQKLENDPEPVKVIENNLGPTMEENNKRITTNLNLRLNDSPRQGLKAALNESANKSLVKPIATDSEKKKTDKPAVKKEIKTKPKPEERKPKAVMPAKIPEQEENGGYN